MFGTQGIVGRCRIVFCLAVINMFSISLAAERPTFNRDTCDPRPDILPYWLTSWHTSYRQRYNRPSYWSGKIAHCIEPTSQEAMVWCEASRMGLYKGHHHGSDNPAVCKRYFYPKPWEILETGPRPDHARLDPLKAVASPEEAEKSSRNSFSESANESSEKSSDKPASDQPADSSPSDQRVPPPVKSDTTSYSTEPFTVTPQRLVELPPIESGTQQSPGQSATMKRPAIDRANALRIN